MNSLYLIEISHSFRPTEAAFSRHNNPPRVYSPLTWSSCKRLMDAIDYAKCRKEIFVGMHSMSISLHPEIEI